mmetsp:Transcript_30929/g.100710  ORF Transcript_30929/g.100710 Transcript_30929/m.100710 type:complete len:277 (+) Transcript_30929:3381-4211(+)
MIYCRLDLPFICIDLFEGAAHHWGFCGVTVREEERMSSSEGAQPGAAMPTSVVERCVLVVRLPFEAAEAEGGSRQMCGDDAPRALILPGSVNHSEVDEAHVRSCDDVWLDRSERGRAVKEPRGAVVPSGVREGDEAQGDAAAIGVARGVHPSVQAAPALAIQCLREVIHHRRRRRHRRAIGEQTYSTGIASPVRFSPLCCDAPQPRSLEIRSARNQVRCALRSTQVCRFASFDGPSRPRPRRKLEVFFLGLCHHSIRFVRSHNSFVLFARAFDDDV